VSHYHDENDLKLLRELKKSAPADFQAWVNLDAITQREDGQISRK